MFITRLRACNAAYSLTSLAFPVDDPPSVWPALPGPTHSRLLAAPLDPLKSCVDNQRCRSGAAHWRYHRRKRRACTRPACTFLFTPTFEPRFVVFFIRCVVALSLYLATGWPLGTVPCCAGMPCMASAHMVSCTHRWYRAHTPGTAVSVSRRAACLARYWLIKHRLLWLHAHTASTVHTPPRQALEQGRDSLH